MRILTILAFIFLGSGVVVSAQEQQWGSPPWERSQGQPNARPTLRTPGGGQSPRSNAPLQSVQRGGTQQRGGMSQGMPPQRGGGGNADRTVEMFRSMDRNRNGILETNEIPDSRRAFVNVIAGRMGVDPNRPINLADLARRAAAGNNTPSRNNGNNRGQSERNRARSSSAAVTEPLVPPFGEQKPAETPALAFGQREIVAAPVIVNSIPAAANQLIQAVQPTTRQSVPYSHLPADVRENTSLDWFFAYDKDADSQLTMQEYVGGYGGIWTPAIASEFRFLDRNGDGFSTIDEVLLTLKEVDEQRAAEATAAAQEAERNRTVSAPTGGLQQASPGNQGQPPVMPGISRSSGQGNAVNQAGQLSGSARNSSENGQNNGNRREESTRGRRGNNSRSR